MVFQKEMKLLIISAVYEYLKRNLDWRFTCSWEFSDYLVVRYDQIEIVGLHFCDEFVSIVPMDYSGNIEIGYTNPDMLSIVTECALRFQVK